MSASFEELGFRQTPIGDLSLRRRRELSLDVDVYEIKLGEEFLMSSLFTSSEIALADLGLTALQNSTKDILVGGLGLGYTAQTVLKCAGVSSLTVVETLDTVIDWHATGLLPLGPELTGDSRCRFVHGDFFALALSNEGFDPHSPTRKFDAILVDIDHSPEFLLNPKNAAFYEPDGLLKLATHLQDGGIFGLWSNDLPDTSFTEKLANVFAEAWVEEVTFDNPLQGNQFTQTIYLARKSDP